MQSVNLSLVTWTHELITRDKKNPRVRDVKMYQQGKFRRTAFLLIFLQLMRQKLGWIFNRPAKVKDLSSDKQVELINAKLLKLCIALKLMHSEFYKQYNKYTIIQPLKVPFVLAFSEQLKSLLSHQGGNTYLWRTSRKCKVISKQTMPGICL